MKSLIFVLLFMITGWCQTPIYTLYSSTNHKVYYPSIAYGAGRYVVAGGVGGVDNGRFKFSSDLQTWIDSTTGVLPHASVAAVKFVDSIFIAVCDAFTATYRIKTSIDGMNWINRSSDLPAFYDVGFGNSWYVAIGYATSGFGAVRSQDAISWSGVSNVYGPHWHGIAYGNGVFVMVSNDYTSRIRYSSDNGSTWNTANGTWNYTFSDVCFGNNMFVAVTFSDEISVHSIDGINWVKDTIPIGTGVASQITYGNGVFMVSDFNSTYDFYYSSDAVTWTLYNYTSATYHWRGVCFDGASFVGVDTDADRFMKITFPLPPNQCDTLTIGTTDNSCGAVITIGDVINNCGTLLTY